MAARMNPFDQFDGQPAPASATPDGGQAPSNPFDRFGPQANADHSARGGNPFDAFGQTTALPADASPGSNDTPAPAPPASLLGAAFKSLVPGQMGTTLARHGDDLTVSSRAGLQGAQQHALTAIRDTAAGLAPTAAFVANPFQPPEHVLGAAQTTRTRIQQLADQAGARRQAIRGELSPQAQAQDQEAARLYEEEGLFSGISHQIANPSSIARLLAESSPATAAAVVGGRFGARGVVAVTAPLGAGESMADARDSIMALTEDEAARVPGYQAARLEGLGHRDALERVAEASRDVAGMVGAGAGALAGVAGLNPIEHVLARQVTGRGASNILGKVGSSRAGSALREIGGEVPEELGITLGANLGQQAAGLDVDTFQGAAQAAGGAMLAGGTMGAMVPGRTPAPAPAPAATATAQIEEAAARQPLRDLIDPRNKDLRVDHAWSQWRQPATGADVTFAGEPIAAAAQSAPIGPLSRAATMIEAAGMPGVDPEAAAMPTTSAITPTRADEPAPGVPADAAPQSSASAPGEVPGHLSALWQLAQEASRSGDPGRVETAQQVLAMLQATTVPDAASTNGAHGDLTLPNRAAAPGATDPDSGQVGTWPQVSPTPVPRDEAGNPAAAAALPGRTDLTEASPLMDAGGPATTATQDPVAPATHEAARWPADGRPALPPMEPLGQKGLLVHGDPELLRARLTAGGFRKKGSIHASGALRFNRSDQEAITRALAPADAPASMSPNSLEPAQAPQAGRSAEVAGAFTPMDVAQAQQAWQEHGTASPWFQRWFAGSKAMNDHGTPLIVHHGTASDFTVFESDHAGASTGHATAPLGHFFAEDRPAAQRYAENAADGMPMYERVIDTYLAIQNPATLTPAQLQAIQNQDQARELRAQLEQQGHDGIHVPAWGQWVAFQPNQIKSAADNRGTFNPAEQDIRLSRRGSPDSLGRRPALGNEEVRRIAERVARVPRNAHEVVIPIKVVDNGTALPEAVREFLQAEGTPLTEIRGVHWEGTSYLVADQLTSAAQVHELVFHEHFTHGGLRRRYGNRLGIELKRLLQGVGGLDGLQALAREQRIDLSAYEQALARNEQMPEALKPLILMEELLAHASQTTGTLKRTIEEWVGALRNWLRTMGFAELADYGITDLAHVLRQARTAVQEKAAAGDARPFFQRAWHGTPQRDIERDGFRMSHIGTGEGAQAFGWGIYFAGRQEVAEHYRTGLSYREQVRQFRQELPDDATIDEVMGAADRGELPEATANVVHALAADDWLGFDYPAQAITAAFRNLDNFDASPDLRAAIRRYAGQLYNTNIPEDSELLDWDMPLSQQPEKVRQALQEMGTLDPSTVFQDSQTGQQIYQALARKYAAGVGDGQRQASETLRWHGIPGLRYLDGGSRDGRGNSANYVIWDEALLTPAAADITPMFSRSQVDPAAVEPFDHLSRDQQQALGKISTWAGREPFAARAQRLTENWRTKLVQGMFDQFRPLKDLDDTAYMQARLSKGTDGALEAVFRYGPPKLTDGALDVTSDRQGLQGVLAELQGEHDLFLAWVAGNRAVKLAGEGREHLFNDREIDALLRLNRGQMPDGSRRSAAYAKAQRALNRYQKAILDIATEAGLISSESRQQWQSEFYVPFYRVMDGDSTVGPGDIGGLVGQRAFQRLKGGKEPLGDLLANTLSNWSHLLSASMKNMAGQRALTAAEQLGVAERVNQAERGSVRVMAHGRPRHYLVNDPLVLDALTMLHHPGWDNPAMKAMSWFKRALTVGVTTSPTFRIRNLIRDTVSALASNRIGFNPLRNLVDGWKGTEKTSEIYQRLLGGGGAIRFGSLLDGDQAAHAKRLIGTGVNAAQILDTPAKAQNALRRAWDWYQEGGDRAESVNRAAIYQRAIQDGSSHLEASFLARDLLDFTMGGKWAAVRFLTQIVPFMNARLQGMYKLGRGAKEDPRRFSAVTGAVALASVLLHLVNRDDDEYRALPDWVRDTYWWVRLPGTDHALYIPKPFEVGALGSVAERATELMTAGDDYRAADFIQTMKGVVSDQLAMNPIPQAVKPFMEAAFNRDTFRGRNIDSMGQERLPPGDRYTAHTSAGAVALGQSLGYSPQRIEHMVRGYFGWLGSQALSVADLMARPGMDIPVSPRQDLSRVENWPVLGDFLKSTASGAGNKYLSRFYDTQRQLDWFYTAYTEARRAGDLDRMMKMAGDDRMQQRRIYNGANKQISRLNQRIRLITNARGLTAAEKRQMLDGLHELRNQIAERADMWGRALESKR